MDYLCHFYNILSFLSLRVFGLLSTSLLLFPQCFGRYVLRPSSGVCRTREPSRNFELRSLLNPQVDVVKSFVKVPEFDKHLKKAGGHIDRNGVEITITVKTIVRKPLMIKIIQLRLRNVDNCIFFDTLKYLKWTYPSYSCLKNTTLIEIHFHSCTYTYN